MSDVAHGPITMAQLVERLTRDRPKSMKTGSGISTAKQWENGLGICFTWITPPYQYKKMSHLGLDTPRFDGLYFYEFLFH